MNSVTTSLKESVQPINAPNMNSVTTSLKESVQPINAPNMNSVTTSLKESVQPINAPNMNSAAKLEVLSSQLKAASQLDDDCSMLTTNSAINPEPLPSQH
jgi:hypothetical protein